MIDDKESHEILKQVADGRTQRQMQALMAVAHQELALECECEMHAALIAKRGQMSANGVTLDPHGQVTLDSERWDDLIAHLSDQQGLNHIPVALGLVWRAALLRDQVLLERYLYLLVKAASRTFPSVKAAIESDLANTKGKL